MNIIEKVLQEAIGDIRITYGHAWLVWSDSDNAWRVYRKSPYQRGTKTVIVTKEIQEAIDKLLEG